MFSCLLSTCLFANGLSALQKRMALASRCSQLHPESGTGVAQELPVEQLKA